jgi:hypothetical protein
MLNKTPHFRHPAVRDLAWVIGSTPMLDDPNKKSGLNLIDNQWVEDRFTRHLDWIYKQDEDPTQLMNYLANEHIELVGKRFEALMKYWFTHHPDFQLLLSNIQVKQQERTLGEIDFILKDHWSEETYHLEIACKYYYAHAPSADWNEWWGPNHQDRLALKMQKFHAQTGLLRTAEGRAVMRSHGLKRMPSAVLLKGYLFFPYNQLGAYPAPHLAFKRHNSGWYVHRNDLAIFKGDTPQWVILPRAHWLAPYHSENNPLPILTGSEMYELIHDKDQDRASLVAQITPADNGEFREINRGIVR